MPRITYVPLDGEPIHTDAMVDMTLMEVALINDVPGILGLCGGICSCATCHLAVDADWNVRLPQASGEEQEMVGALAQAAEGSRLGCQIRVEENMDGLVVRVMPAE